MRFVCDVTIVAVIVTVASVYGANDPRVRGVRNVCVCGVRSARIECVYVVCATCVYVVCEACVSSVYMWCAYRVCICGIDKRFVRVCNGC